ncbi:ankyrin repeat family protein [Striga asiatica]|uniref:Ankyrin repeat family protein n=1 Tax=Striga asiatica TaxID=4170 RepID=A0A5A7Q4U6_STRAF|nr:ankyrin repeat family protein [Striga asiatica]
MIIIQINLGIQCKVSLVEMLKVIFPAMLIEDNENEDINDGRDYDDFNGEANVHENDSKNDDEIEQLEQDNVNEDIIEEDTFGSTETLKLIGWRMRVVFFTFRATVTDPFTFRTVMDGLLKSSTL